MRLLSELKGKKESMVRIHIDNQSAIQLSKNHVFHDRSKHIDTRYHFIRDCVEEGRVDVVSIDTTEQLADILTKALPLGRRNLDFVMHTAQKLYFRRMVRRNLLISCADWTKFVCPIKETWKTAQKEETEENKRS